MTALHPQYITDKDGTKLSVVLPMEEYEQILAELEELEDIKLYDEAKADNSTAIDFDEYVKRRRSK